MRRARWLFLAAIVAIIATVGATYLKLRERTTADSTDSPALLEKGTESRAEGWRYTQSDGDRPRFTVRAQSIRQIQEPSLMELNGVELELFHANGKDYDLMKSARAEFDVAARSLFSDGPVEITMGLNEGTPRHARLLNIHTSGVHFASDTGKATTDRAARFEFGQGSGSAVGAEYDPNLRELLLKSQVSLDWRSANPDAPPGTPMMHVESGEAIYRERDANVHLKPWTKLTRGTLHMEGGESLVTLNKGVVQDAAINNARGVQDDPRRKVEFAADDLTLSFGEGMVVREIHGQRNTRLVSTAPATRTTVTSDRMDLVFTPSGHEAILSNAVAAGNGVAEAAPIIDAEARAGVEPPETRTLRSDVIRTIMRPGGREIEQVQTDGPATLDFIPNRPAQARRTLKGDRVWIDYGAENRIKSFRSTNVSTRTDRPAQSGKPAPAPVTTESKEMVASFDPATSQLVRAEQKTGFRYQEGDRRGQSDRATLEQTTDVITLEGAARVWDPTGSADADRIVLDQKTGDYTAEGRVATTRQPDRKGASSAILSNQEVMQARSQKLVSTGRNQHLNYEGNAVAWQGANRVTADRIEIDREHRTMEAHGKVVSQFVDKTPAPNTKADAKAKPAAPVFTVVRAPDLEYAEETRVAYYHGGVSLARPGLGVNSRELRAFLKDSSSDTALDKAYADGGVNILSTSTGAKGKRTRTGLSEHSEYYPADQKLMLEGGQPQLVDSEQGKTTGKQLTWFANNDRLLVDGEEQKPAVSTLRKK